MVKHYKAILFHVTNTCCDRMGEGNKGLLCYVSLAIIYKHDVGLYCIYAGLSISESQVSWVFVRHGLLFIIIVNNNVQKCCMQQAPVTQL